MDLSVAYRLLDLPESASLATIIATHRRLVRQLHPDANPTAPAGAFSATQTAYETILRARQADQPMPLSPHIEDRQQLDRAPITDMAKALVWSASIEAELKALIAQTAEASRQRSPGDNSSAR
jgi:hypothetical protein